MKGFRVWGLATSKIIAFLLISFVFLYPIPYTLYPIFAQEDNIGASRISPASPLYFLKSVREILELKFAGTTNIKTLRQIEFATRRIREVKSLVKTSRQDLIEPTLEKYLFHLGELLGIVDLKDPGFVTEVSGNVTAHMNVLQAVYGQVSDRRALMSIRATINSLSKWDQELIDRLNLAKKESAAKQLSISKLFGCNFLAKEASSSGLNEVERVVLLERAQKCSNPKP